MANFLETLGNTPQQGILSGMPYSWLDALSRLSQGRVSDLSQDRLYAAHTQPWQWNRTDTGVQAGETQGGLLGMRPQWVPDTPSGGADALPFGSPSDPVSQLAFAIAPGILQGLRSFIGEQAPSIMLRGGFLANERGSIGNTSGKSKSSLDDLKKMFLERGGVESGEGVSIPGSMSYKQHLSYMKNVKPVTNIYDDINAISMDNPHYKPFIKQAKKTYSDEAILNSFNTNQELRDILDNTYKLTTSPTKDIDSLVKFAENNINKRIKTIDDGIELGYIDIVNDKNGIDLGYILSEKGMNRVFQHYLRLNSLGQ